MSDNNDKRQRLEACLTDLENAYNMSDVPDKEKFPKYKNPQSAVIDEEKSVKWNREEAIKRNEIWKEMKYFLTLERHEAIRDCEEALMEFLAEDIGLLYETTGAIWDYVMGERGMNGHAYDARKMIEPFYKYADFYKKIKNIEIWEELRNVKEEVGNYEEIDEAGDTDNLLSV